MFDPTSVQIPTEAYVPVAFGLLMLALLFGGIAYLMAVPTLALCAGVCLATGGRVALRAARTPGMSSR